jgi:hypothetical protein
MIDLIFAIELVLNCGLVIVELFAIYIFYGISETRNNYKREIANVLSDLFRLLPTANSGIYQQLQIEIEYIEKKLNVNIPTTNNNRNVMNVAIGSLFAILGATIITTCVLIYIANQKSIIDSDIFIIIIIKTLILLLLILVTVILSIKYIMSKYRCLDVDVIQNNILYY